MNDKDFEELTKRPYDNELKLFENIITRLFNDELTLDEKQKIANYLRWILYQNLDFIEFIKGGKE